MELNLKAILKGKLSDRDKLDQEIIDLEKQIKLEGKS